MNNYRLEDSNHLSKTCMSWFYSGIISRTMVLCLFYKSILVSEHLHWKELVNRRCSLYIGYLPIVVLSCFCCFFFLLFFFVVFFSMAGFGIW